MILDSGERTVHENGFQRDMHEGKGRMDLLPWRGIMELSKHCEEGAKKYGERNIDLGAPQKSLIDSAFRHLAKYHIGMTDENHLRACAWNILWALEQEVCRPDLIRIYRSEMNVSQVDDDLREINKKVKKLSEIKEAYWRFKISGDGNAGMTLLGELDKLLSESGEPVPEVTPNERRRCVEMTCFNNTDGICESVGDLWDPELGNDCPDFMED